MEKNEHAVFQQNFIYGLKFEFHIIFHMSQNMFSFDLFDHLTMYKSFLAHTVEIREWGGYASTSLPTYALEDRTWAIE